MKYLLQLIANSAFRISPKFYYGLRYFIVRKKMPDFQHPEDLSEYLLSEMLKPDFKQFADYADKIKVRQYVEEKGLASILPEIYGVWNDSKDIDFEKLPASFALKTNHGCGNHILCKDKSRLDVQQARKQMDNLVKKTFSIREPHYKFIAPRIYAEELIQYTDGAALTDYKFMCVKGEIQCILTCSERSKDFHKVKLCTLDTDWNMLPWMNKKDCSCTIPKRPKHLAEMVQIAKRLSADFDFVRVDLYDTGEKVYFGELTFTPNSGLLTYWTTDTLRIMAKGLRQPRPTPSHA